ncbi:hypothetical protein [Bosea sp. 117]|uniref:hypothetical protein n=1 Tax=Bosea sp. 117 TaxID=1125973 RepID=UPI0012DC25AC|nr:hypothetical protein [Bosea sp. 117]
MLAALRRLLPGRTRTRMLEGASGKRWDRVPPFGPLSTEVMAGASAVRGRARHLRHNDPLAANAATILKTGLVGYGVTAASAHPDATVREDWMRGSPNGRDHPVLEHFRVRWSTPS